MRKPYLYCTLILFTALLTLIYGCKKVNGINNNTVIETPYSLYFSDTAGILYNSNDGISHNVVFPTDGFPCRAICTSGTNILWAKQDLFASTNNGVNFNHTFDSLQWVSIPPCVGITPLNLNQSMIIDIPAWGRVYTVTNKVHYQPAGIVDYLGVEYSNNHGVPGSWVNEATYDTAGGVGLLPVKMYSYTMLTNGVLCGLAKSNYFDPTTLIGDTTHLRNFYKACGTDACRWMETTGRNIAGTLDTGGVPLPPNTTYPDTGAFFTLGHYNNRLIAIDQTCLYGAFYSDDTGRNWMHYNGLPVGVPLLCISSPFDEICLVGTYGKGLYVLNPNTNTFQANNNGLANNLIIRSISAKENIYKNTTTKRYIYLATNKGIFQSTDDGINWVLTIPGNYVAVY